jgi:hypothetical protein
MKRGILALGVLFVFACTKTEAPSPPPTPTNPVVITPTVPAACPVVSISDINKKTSHFNPYFIPFIDYWGISKLSPSNCTDITGRTFLNINNNDIPDLIITITNGCGFDKGKTLVYVDNILKWSFEDPQILTRKVARGDLNGDGIDDVVLFGHGHDGPPYAGDKNYIIYFKQDSYSLVLLDSVSAYHHTGCIGDINNDGYLDVIPVANQMKDCYAFLNDGKGNFTKKKILDAKETDVSYHMELYDFNKDGNLDIIMGGHEWADFPFQSPTNRIMYGDGKGNFDVVNALKLPSVNGWGVITDFDIYDLDNDGAEEIVVTRTAGSLGTGKNGPQKNPKGFYDDFRIQVIKKVGSAYAQAQLLQSPSEWEKTSYQWIDWVSVKDIDGDCILDIVPDSERLNMPNHFELSPFNKLYYKGDGKGGFIIAYKK